MFYFPCGFEIITSLQNHTGNHVVSTKPQMHKTWHFKSPKYSHQKIDVKHDIFFPASNIKHMI